MYPNYINELVEKELKKGSARTLVLFGKALEMITESKMKKIEK